MRRLSLSFLASLPLLFACQEAPGPAEVTLTPESPTTTDDITVVFLSQSVDPNGKDTVSYRYQWFQDGTLLPDETGDGVSAELTAKGEVWKVFVTPSDGEFDGLVASAEVTVINTPPTMTSLEITPESPTTEDDLLAVAVGADIDGDEVSFTFSWESGDTVISTDSLLAAETAKDENWVLSATPTDGEEEGESLSASVVIDNTAPVVTSVSLSPATPSTTDAITATVESGDSDDDAVTLTYVFSVDGVEVQTETLDAGVDSVLDAALFAKHQSATVLVTPSDGLQDGIAVESDALVVVNTAPEITGASLDLTEAYESSTITCVPAGWADADGDTEGYAWSWTVNGSDASVALSTVDGSSFSKGDVVACTATPDDGEATGTAFTSDPLTISNTAPVIGSVLLSASVPAEGDTLSAVVSGASDDDGDTVLYTYEWFVDSAGTVFTETLTSLYFDKNQEVYVVVTPTDGVDEGAGVQSNTATVQNTAPVVDSATLTPSDVYTDTVVNMAVVVSDVDPSDSPTSSVTWYVNGVPQTSATGTSLDGVSYFDKGQTVYAQVTATDGAATSAPVQTSAVTVQNTAPGAPGISVSPSAAEPGVDDLLCSVDTPSADADSDVVTYGFDWDVDGTAYPGIPTETATLSTVAGSETTAGETWTCTVTPDDGDAAGATASSEVVINSAYEVIHTGGGGDGMRWGHPHYGDVSGNYDVISNVSSEEACAALCSSETDYSCAGFMYKFDGTYNTHAPDSWLDQACTLLEILESAPTSVTSLSSAAML